MWPEPTGWTSTESEGFRPREVLFQQFSAFSPHGARKLITNILWHTKKIYFLPIWQKNRYNVDSLTPDLYCVGCRHVSIRQSPGKEVPDWTVSWVVHVLKVLTHWLKIAVLFDSCALDNEHFIFQTNTFHFKCLSAACWSMKWPSNLLKPIVAQGCVSGVLPCIEMLYKVQFLDFFNLPPQCQLSLVQVPASEVTKPSFSWLLLICSCLENYICELI